MTLLVIDDNRSVLAAVRLIAEMKFDRVVTSTSPSRIPALLREEHPDCVLLDMNFNTTVNNGNEGLYWLSEIQRLAPGVPVVLFTAYAEIGLAVEGIKSGAADFVIKPWDNARLLQTLLHAARTAQPAATPSTTDNATPSRPTASPDSLPTLEEMERRMITRALADNGGNLTLAAATLGITRQTLYNKIRRYNLTQPS